jgi:hypothetical protein
LDFQDFFVYLVHVLTASILFYRLLEPRIISLISTDGEREGAEIETDEINEKTVVSTPVE